MRNGQLLLAVACLAGCSDSAVKDAVRESLVDPDSAKFGDIAYSNNGDWACVETNAKNKMGGYAGASQIVVSKVNGEWTAIDDTEYDEVDCLKTINELESDEAEKRK